MLSTHPCIVCGSPHQTCTGESGMTPDPADPDDRAPIDVGGGPLTPFVIDGCTFLFSADEAEARGLA